MKFPITQHHLENAHQMENFQLFKEMYLAIDIS